MRTSLYTILCIAIRTAVLWFGLQAMLLFAQAVRIEFGPRGATSEFFWAAGAAFFCFALAFVLWLWPGIVARLAAPRAAMEVFESPIAPQELQYVAISLLGISFAFDGMVRLIHEFLPVIGVSASYASDSVVYLLKREFGDILASVSRVVIGVALTFGARGLTGLLRGFRHGALPQAVADDAPL